MSATMTGHLPSLADCKVWDQSRLQSSHTRSRARPLIETDRNELFMVWAHPSQQTSHLNNHFQQSFTDRGSFLLVQKKSGQIISEINKIFKIYHCVHCSNLAKGSNNFLEDFLQGLNTCISWNHVNFVLP